MSRALLFCWVAAAGCSDQTFVPTSKDAGGEGPAIEVTPDHLDFGTLGPDDSAVVQSYTVRSVGATELLVSDMIVDGDGALSFTILSESTVLELPPGAEESIDVAFAPLGANAEEATIFVYSNDEDRSLVPVYLTGEGLIPELEIRPDPVEFGNAYAGCPKDLPTELTNIGTDTLVIDGISYSGDGAFSLVNDWSLPITLEPGASTTVTVTFEPGDAVDYFGDLAVSSNEPMGVRHAEITGTGRFAGEYLDSYAVPSDPPSDIFFAIDQSCSMDDDIAKLSGDFSNFINELSSYSTDWQVMAVTEDDGCSNTGVLTPSTPNYANTFSAGVSGSEGWLTEALLSIAANGVEETGPSDCNTGFLREDALLHVILVSDEPEQSDVITGETWNVLADRMATAKGSLAMTHISAVAGPVPGGCATADAGSGYYEAVNYTGGVFLSICSDWTSPSNLAMLAEASVNQNTFSLTHTPMPDSIAVDVNGVVSTNWTYDSTSNAVVFSDPAPGEGDVVDIAYAGLASCD